MKIERYFFEDDGVIPNSKLAVVVYRQVCSVEDKSLWFENTFIENGWTNNWRDVIMSDDHFHSTTHEVLGVGRGKATLQVGGRNGARLHVTAGDMIIIPAGVGHFGADSSDDYEIVGGYPDGRAWNIMFGSEAERKLAFQQISTIPTPSKDPIDGYHGHLFKCWGQE
jgi:uncharacterized protein YjlB